MVNETGSSSAKFLREAAQKKGAGARDRRSMDLAERGRARATQLLGASSDVQHLSSELVGALLLAARQSRWLGTPAAASAAVPPARASDCAHVPRHAAHAAQERQGSPWSPACRMRWSHAQGARRSAGRTTPSARWPRVLANIAEHAAGQQARRDLDLQPQPTEGVQDQAAVKRSMEKARPPAHPHSPCAAPACALSACGTASGVRSLLDGDRSSCLPVRWPVRGGQTRPWLQHASPSQLGECAGPGPAGHCECGWPHSAKPPGSGGGGGRRSRPGSRANSISSRRSLASRRSGGSQVWPLAGSHTPASLPVRPPASSAACPQELHQPAASLSQPLDARQARYPLQPERSPHARGWARGSARPAQQAAFSSWSCPAHARHGGPSPSRAARSPALRHAGAASGPGRLL